VRCRRIVRECCLVAIPGLGKTCILRAVRHRLSPTASLTHLPPQCDTLGNATSTARSAGPRSAPPRPPPAFYAISSHVCRTSARACASCLLLDEAHLLHPETLDHLHILLNYEWDAERSCRLSSLAFRSLDRLAPRNRSCCRGFTAASSSGRSPTTIRRTTRAELNDATRQP
jgi:hypothetical protein